MKTLLFAVVAGFLLVSCTSGPEHEHGSDSPTSAKHEEGAGAKDLQLNNGSKWNADSITNANVGRLRETVQKFNAATDRSLAAYAVAGAELQAGLDKMISECKMKGADHEALHKWLVPLIGEVDKLKKLKNEQEGTEIMKDIDQHLQRYDQYFE